MNVRLCRLWMLACSSVVLMLAATYASNADTGSDESPFLHKMEWRNVGPWIGGRVVAVAGVPGRNLFYMGAVGGGVWRSTSFGVSWVNISDGTLPGSSGSIGAIAVAPSNANVIYVGTGESDIRGDVITGDGLYKSTDAGKTWRYIGLGDSHTTSAILVDPKNPAIVYASSMGHVFAPNAERGVYKSVDGGRTWRKVLFVDNDTGAISLAMEPNRPNVLYAAMWQAYRKPWILSSGGPGSGLFKSTDAGEHWTNISRHPGFATGVLGKIGVAVAPSNPNIVYAIAQAKEGGVFRSNDGGATWKRVNAEWKLRQRAFYYMNIFVDPKNPQVVYVPEVDALWVSRDGGKVFAKLRTPHGDNHILWIDPNDPRILLEGNDGGATVSTDGGATWSSEHNQPTGQFYHVSLDNQFPYHIYGAQQDEDSYEGPSASSRGYIDVGDWHSVAYGESTFVAPQPDDPNVTYGSGYYSILIRYDFRTGQYQSVSPWPNFQAGAAASELKYRFTWTHPILFSATNSKELLVGAQYVLKSDDYGQTWRVISPDLTRNDPTTEGPTGGPIDLDQTSAEVFPGVSALATSAVDGKLMWAGSDDGLVWVTSDAGATWQNVTPPDLPQRAQISSIEPSHAAPGTAYVSASRYMWDDFHPYIFATTDYGRHWTRATTGLPGDQYVFVIRQDPNQPDLLFSGTKNTVYVSFDGGAHWQSLALNLPRAQVRDIAINTREGDVVVATHGRAFWVLDNLAFLEQTSKVVGQNTDGHVFGPQTAWLTHAYGSSESAARLPVGKNPSFGATVFFNIPRSYNGKTPVVLQFVDAQGQMVRSFSLHLKKKTEPSEAQRDQMTPAQLKQAALDTLTGIEPGMNRFTWNLRYPDATEVNGFWTPIAAGGLPDDVNGPMVAPGRYSVVLDYGGGRSQASFDVALDPRLTATPQDLAARLALELHIHATLDALDKAINDALAERNKLNAAVSTGRLTGSKPRAALAALDDEIGQLVQMDIHSSEGQLLHEAKLRSHLAYLAADIDLAFERPTAAQYAVFEELDRQAKSGEQKLQVAMSEARQLH